MAGQVGREVCARRDGLRRESLRHQGRGLLGPDDRRQVRGRVDLVHHDHVTVVIASEVQRAAISAPVESEKPAARYVVEWRDLWRREKRRREWVRAIALDRELERDGHDRNVLDLRAEARLAELLRKAAPLVGVADADRGLRRIGKPCGGQQGDHRCFPETNAGWREQKKVTHKVRDRVDGDIASQRTLTTSDYSA